MDRNAPAKPAECATSHPTSARSAPSSPAACIRLRAARRERHRRSYLRTTEKVAFTSLRHQSGHAKPRPTGETA